ncbi:MAG: sulfatase, partial [Myxococcales bacterium]|nr:sulfatase [Polyangiaceae bacterium]MDW8248827.1 sulfatase [Myxococcales bacterium]
MRAFLDATIVALILLFAEAAFFSFLHRRQFADLSEMRLGLYLLPLITWLLAAPVAWLGALVQLLVRRQARTVVSAFTLIATTVLAFFLSTGRHMAALPIRFLLLLLSALISASFTWLLVPRLARAEAQAPFAVGASALALALTLMAANIWILPRLYPPFHVGLALLTILLSPWIALLWVGNEALRPCSLRFLASYAALVALALGTVAFSLPSMHHALARADNVRIVLGDRTPTVRYGVRALTLLDSPSYSVADTSSEPGTSPMQDLQGPDWRGHDLLLLTVDALRADHLGAYGYPRKITPYLDRLAAEGTTFRYAYTATPHTSYAVSSLMTGKYMRPLMLQGVGDDPDTLARLLRGYGYRTAAFYPPAVFFVDAERFEALRDRGLDFEYRKVEFASALRRVEQVEAYLKRLKPDRRSFLWVHLFEPHEPYERHPDYNLGDRDIDRYDSEIAAVDAGVRLLVERVRAYRPNTIVLFSSDHGEEFGEHGGRYHGTTVYEEQVRVPLMIHAPGLIPARQIEAPVQTIDLLPTILAALRIPRPARVRGRDLGSYLGPTEPFAGLGFAFAETDESTMLAEGSLRLVCARKLGAC